MNQKYQINIDEFKPIKLISEGERNKVYLVSNLTNGKNFAAKVRINKQTTDEEQQKFINEIDILSKVENPAVLPFLGFSFKNFDQKDYPTILTEYMPNGSLSQIFLLERRSQAPLKWANTKKYINLLGIALGMKYLHSQNIIHSELNPSNILLDSKLYPYISNFCGKSKSNELAKINMEIRSEGLYYVAPEILKCQSYDFKADIYSYSLIFYEILTGKRPYLDYQSPIEIQSIIQGQRPELSIVPNDKIKFFLQKCWSNNPPERPTFEDIISFLIDETFYKPFKINAAKVNKYLKLFERESIQLQIQSSQNTTSIHGIIKDNNNTRRSSYSGVVVLVGNGYGKTSLVNSFIDGTFDEFTPQTICANYRNKAIQTSSGEVDISLWDTNDRGRFNIIFSQLYVQRANAVIIAISAEDESHWRDDASKKITDIKEVNKNARIYIAVTKCDLEMTIPLNELAEFADENNCLLFLTSAKTDPDSVNSMFLKIACDIIDDDNNQNTDNNVLYQDDDNNCFCNVF